MKRKALIEQWEQKHKGQILWTETRYTAFYDKVVFKLTDRTIVVFYRPK